MICAFHANRIKELQIKHKDSWRITDEVDKALLEESHEVIKQIASACSYYPNHYIHYNE